MNRINSVYQNPINTNYKYSVNNTSPSFKGNYRLAETTVNNKGNVLRGIIGFLGSLGILKVAKDAGKTQEEAQVTETKPNSEAPIQAQKVETEPQIQVQEAPIQVKETTEEKRDNIIAECVKNAGAMETPITEKGALKMAKDIAQKRASKSMISVSESERAAAKQAVLRGENPNPDPEFYSERNMRLCEEREIALFGEPFKIEDFKLYGHTVLKYRGIYEVYIPHRHVRFGSYDELDKFLRWHGPKK